MRSSSFSLGYTAGLAALLAGVGALGLLITGEGAAGLGMAEPVGLLVAAGLFAGAGVATRTAPPAPWPRLAGVVGVVLVAVLCFLAFAEPEVSSVVFLEAAAVLSGALFVAGAGRRTSP
jgi:hypothetical protein